MDIAANVDSQQLFGEHRGANPIQAVKLPNQYLSKVKSFINKVITAQEKSEPETSEPRKQSVTVRDLKPKKDANGGASIPGGGSKPPSARTGEIDFMKDVQ